MSKIVLPHWIDKIEELHNEGFLNGKNLLKIRGVVYHNEVGQFSSDSCNDREIMQSIDIDSLLDEVDEFIDCVPEARFVA